MTPRRNSDLAHCTGWSGYPPDAAIVRQQSTIHQQPCGTRHLVPLLCLPLHKPLPLAPSFAEQGKASQTSGVPEGTQTLPEKFACSIRTRDLFSEVLGQAQRRTGYF